MYAAQVHLNGPRSRRGAKSGFHPRRSRFSYPCLARGGGFFIFGRGEQLLPYSPDSQHRGTHEPIVAVLWTRREGLVRR
jgi:hypothetical protein